MSDTVPAPENPAAREPETTDGGHIAPEPGSQPAATNAGASAVPPMRGPAAAYPAPAAPGGSAVNVLSIVSLIGGIASFLFLPFIGAIVGIVTGHMALSQLKRKPEQGRAFAITGLVLSYVHMLLALLVVLVLVILGVFAAHSVNDTIGGASQQYNQCVNRVHHDPERVQQCFERYSRQMDKLGR